MIHCGLGGKIPSSLMDMTTLVHLDLSYNVLDDSFLEGWQRLRSLTDINLSYNRLTGQLPFGLFDGYLKLQSVKLDHNLFTGSVSSFETQMFFLEPIRTNRRAFILKVFDVSFNNLSGFVPPNMMQLPGL